MEYMLETKPEKEWQKCLNQWKRKYNVSVEKMASFVAEGNVMVTMLVKRESKFKTEENE